MADQGSKIQPVLTNLTISVFLPGENKISHDVFLPCSQIAISWLLTSFHKISLYSGKKAIFLAKMNLLSKKKSFDAYDIEFINR